MEVGQQAREGVKKNKIKGLDGRKTVKHWDKDCWLEERGMRYRDRMAMEGMKGG